MAVKRHRSVGSIKNELLQKSREAMLSAVQIYNNPSIQFKSETYIVLSIIAWTYLLHAYYRKEKIDYSYYKLSPKGRAVTFSCKVEMLFGQASCFLKYIISF